MVRKVSVSPELLSYINANDVSSYLTAHGWQVAPAVRATDGYVYYVAPVVDDRKEPIRLAIPTTNDAPNFAGLTARAIGIAAAIEGRTGDDIATEMSIVAIDMIDIRILPRGGGDRIRLKDSPKVYGAISSLFSFGAAVEHGPDDRIGDDDGFLVAPAKPRSFSFRVESVMRGVVSRIAGTGDAPLPIQRRTVNRIVRGLSRCRNASESGWTNPEEESAVGLNGSMCDSLLELHQASCGADVEFGATWSTRYPVAADIAGIKTILYTSGMATKVHELADVLRKRRPPHVAEIEGTVVELRDRMSARQRARMELQPILTYGAHVDFNPDYAVIIKTSSDGVQRNVHVTLSDEDYAKACGAHVSKKRVRATGLMAQRNGKWVLDPLHSFEVMSTRAKRK